MHPHDAPNLSVHYMFYVVRCIPQRPYRYQALQVCQAALYTFCFRVGEFAAMEGGAEFLQALRLEDIVACKLKPLRVCFVYDRSAALMLSQLCHLNVVREFSRITFARQLAVCAPHMKCGVDRACVALKAAGVDCT